MNLKQRLDLIIKELGLSGRAFEKVCGLSNGSYSSIGDGVGADKLNKILFKYPQISADWLLLGKGEMFKKTETVNSVDGGDERDVIFRLADIVSDHQQNIARLITEIERDGERCDRILNIIEKG